MDQLARLFVRTGLIVGLTLAMAAAHASQSNVQNPTMGWSLSQVPTQESPARATSGDVRLAYSCGPGQCTCHGDNDCNNMYSGGSCKSNGSCETAGGVSCTCATRLSVQPTGGNGPKKPILTNRNQTLKKLGQ